MRTVAQKEIGKRRIVGTDWSVEIWLVKIKSGKWAVQQICNGIGEWSKEFDQLSDAQSYYDKAGT